MTLVREGTELSAPDLARSIIEALEAFRLSRPPEDDATLVVIKLKG
jgi:serine phosphatase RsbU (regulator of sigma subunit)